MYVRSYLATSPIHQNNGNYDYDDGDDDGGTDDVIYDVTAAVELLSDIGS